MALISRNEYMYLRSRLAKRDLEISEYELNSKFYSQWFELKSLPYAEYTKRLATWNRHYSDVRNSPIGQFLKEMSQITRHDTGRRLSSETKERMQDISSKSELAKDETNKMLIKPTFEDPLYLEEKISYYKSYIAETENMRKQVAEFKEVFEPSKELKVDKFSI